MISFLHGTLVSALPTQCEVDVHGTGYEVLIPLSTFDKLPAPPAPVRLLTHLVVREDAHLLYGFASAEERELFRLLIQHVSNVGPKIALACLSGMTAADFKACVAANDAAALSRIKGVGRKTAEKIIVELRDKVGVSAAWQASASPNALTPGARAVNDAVLALIALGYKQAEAHAAVRAVQQRDPDAAVDILVRDALKAM